MNPFVGVAVVVTVFAFLLELLCIAMPFWLKYFDISNNIHYYVGLFDLCPSIHNDDHVCVGFDSYSATRASVNDVPSFWKAVRSMELLAIVAVFVAFVFGVVAVTCKKYSGLIHIIAGILDVFAAICGLIAVIVFGVMYDELNSAWDLGGKNLFASFYVALFAVVFAIIGGIFFFLGKPRSSVMSFD